LIQNFNSSMAMRNQNDNNMSNNSLLTEGNDLTSIFQNHHDQFLKFHFFPLLNIPEKTTMRSTCKTMKNNIPTPHYIYFKTPNGFAKARIETNTGFVETCGNPEYGGDSSEVSCELQSNVKAIVSTEYAFAALKKNGSVITWGNPEDGGDSSNVRFYLQSDVKSIFSTNGAFAALKTNGRLIIWGYPEFGGDSSNVSFYLQSDVKSIFSTSYAFAALKINGRVITWGHAEYGGDSSNVSFYLQSDVKSIVQTWGAFAALKANGRVVTWGNPIFCVHSSNVSEFLQNEIIEIKAIRNETFRAIKSDGTQIQWPS